MMTRDTEMAQRRRKLMNGTDAARQGRIAQIGMLDTNRRGHAEWLLAELADIERTIREVQPKANQARFRATDQAMAVMRSHDGLIVTRNWLDAEIGRLVSGEINPGQP
jgi:hypothetical protein